MFSVEKEIPAIRLKKEKKNRENKIEVGTIRYQFLGSKHKKYSNMKFHKMDKKGLPATIPKKMLFIISDSPRTL